MKLIILVILTLMTSLAWSQEEGAPQEAPFIQEDNEFQDYPVNTQDAADALAIEKEIQNSNEKSAVQEQTQSSVPIEQSDSLLEANIQKSPAKAARSVNRKKSDNRRRYTKDGVDYIEHPLAKKGLISIRKDGSYVYKIRKEAKYTQSGIFRVGMMDPPRITAKDGTTYEDMYKPGSQAALFFDFEWQPFQFIGKWGVQAGMGLLMASGSGRYEDPVLADETPNEAYNFFAIPLNVGLVYRMQWVDRQWIAPFVSAGGTYVGLLEARDDGEMTVAGVPGAYGAGGVLLNISALSRDTAFTLSSEYGIKNLWVSLEYRYLKTFNDELNFSSNIIGAGVAVDY